MSNLRPPFFLHKLLHKVFRLKLGGRLCYWLSGGPWMPKMKHPFIGREHE